MSCKKRKKKKGGERGNINREEEREMDGSVRRV
jgi:hypothetical protein